MLLKLPNEILIQVFHNLHQNDQMECMLVCSRWKQLIEESVLFRTVFVYSSASLFKLLDKVEKDADLADKIERVMIYMNPKEKEEAEPCDGHYKLLCLLPNVKAFHGSFVDSLDLDIDFQGISYLYHRELEYVSEQVDERDQLIIHSLLSFHKYPNLTTIRVNQAGDSFFSVLENAPALTHLTIEQGRIEVEKLEQMHEHLPHLQSICFPYIKDLVPYNCDLNITPATSVTECVIGFESNYFSHNYFNGVIRFLVYIYAKYPNLSKLTFNTDSGIPETDEIVDLKNMGWTPLFQALASNLKKLCLNSAYYLDDLFETLDRFSCELNYLSLGRLSYGMLEKMSLSRQVSSIETLVLENTRCEAFAWLKELCVLKKLKLSYCTYNESSDDIQMNDILVHSPPTLESLSLQGIVLVLNLDYSGTSNIKTLSFDDMELDDITDTYISQYFPKLSTLKLHECKLSEKTFDLSKVDLLNFHYIDRYGEYIDSLLSIETLKNNEQRFYPIHNYRHRVAASTSLTAFHPQNYLPIKSYPASEMSDATPTFSLISHSLGNLILT